MLSKELLKSKGILRDVEVEKIKDNLKLRTGTLLMRMKIEEGTSTE